MNIERPSELDPHEPKFTVGAWLEYTPEELGQWVTLLLKRSSKRVGSAEALKDIKDAENYLALLTCHVQAHKEAYIERHWETGDASDAT